MAVRDDAQLSALHIDIDSFVFEPRRPQGGAGRSLLAGSGSSRARSPAPLASLSASACGPAPGPASPAPLTLLPAGVVQGSLTKRYVWDGREVRALSAEDLARGESAASTAVAALRRAAHDLWTAFFPNEKEVSPDYWEYARWRATHRLFSSMSSIFATQSLLQAVGVGARRSLPAAATINWVLKDGLGRLGRLTVATRFGESFDSDLKRFRYTTSLLYAACLGLEYLTPLFPQHFLLMASLANVGKSVGLTTFIATQPAFHRSFARSENMADISAKAQAQQMVMDNIGLAAAVGLTHLCRHSEQARRALPLAALPFLVAGDLYSIYRELRSIHLRTLNKERAEIIAQRWLSGGGIPSPRQVSSEERLILPPAIAAGAAPLSIGSLDATLRCDADLRRFLAQPREQRYTLALAPPAEASASGPAWSLLAPRGAGATGGGRSRAGAGASAVRVSLRSDARAEDVVLALLHAAYLRQEVLRWPTPGSGGGGGRAGLRDGGGAEAAGRGPGGGGGADVEAAVRESGAAARRGLAPFLSALDAGGWQVAPFMLSSTEKRTYVALGAPSL